MLIPKPHKDPTLKENFRLIFLMNIDAKYSIKFSQKIKEHIKTIIHHDQVGFIQECGDGSIYKMFTNTITHYRNKLKEKNHTIIYFIRC